MYKIDKFIILFIYSLLLFLSLIIIACDTRQQKIQEDVTSQDAELKVTAIKLYNDYESNEIAADKKYKDHIIQVSGIVEEVSEVPIVGGLCVTLTGGEYGEARIQCIFPSKEKDQLSNLEKGQKVKIKGKCNGKPMYVGLVGCVLMWFK